MKATDIILFFAAALVSYLVSGLNPAIILSRAIYHKDIRTCGSGNPGFTNFKRSFGGRYAWFVFLLDIAKGMYGAVPCTACRYCTDGCPKHISIPDLFAIMNTKHTHHDWNADCYYEDVHIAPGRKASDCLKCGKCEKVCPQHLPIRKLLEQVAAEFEKPPQRIKLKM